MFKILPGKASSRGRPMRRMKPARQTRSTLASRSWTATWACGFGGEFLAVAVAVDEGLGDAGIFGAFEDVGVGVVAEDEGDFGLEGSVFDGIEEGLHVRAGAGAENTETGHGRSRE